MKVFPAVDILHGKCVQLVQGDPTTKKEFGDPLKCASHWIDKGAEALHVINLDGAFGTANENASSIKSILKETGIEIQLGGGIRSFEDAVEWINIGVERVILGTLALKNPDVITELKDVFGSGKIIAGVDARNGQVLLDGWRKESGDFLSWAHQFEEKGAGSLLFTNVDREGLENGIDYSPVKALLNHVTIPVIVAGGISSPDDVTGIRELGAWGIVLGSALYSNKLTLKEAVLAASR